MHILSKHLAALTLPLVITPTANATFIVDPNNLGYTDVTPIPYTTGDLNIGNNNNNGHVCYVW